MFNSVHLYLVTVKVAAVGVVTKHELINLAVGNVKLIFNF